MEQGAFAFRYTEALPYLLLDSIGWQSTDSPYYGNNGHTRTDNGHVIFQYTLSGEGRLELDGQTYRLTPGKAFIVKIPSDHRYYYPVETGEPWEFIWLNAKGEDAFRMWDRIIEHGGEVIALRDRSLSLSSFWDMYKAVSEEKLSDCAELSVMLYRFMLSLFTPDAGLNTQAENSSIVEKAKHYIKENLTTPVTLEDIAAYCGVSGAYLCRLFQRNKLSSPLEYLRRRRIEAAVTMLRTTEMSAQDIGKQCGFESPSYFSKIFKAYLGFSPREYRVQRVNYPFDTIYLD
ncbi:AraC family transcriptional regulator [Paenibacillus agaridevorans]|uniref:AraC family transcriptional regulator n=1 Tax=Paenibacillus agaridevorans TaxID=171404 RepID=A0A2R5ESS3_9BACL|nr:AraC family transcriptional regulator [Paenibacillus agaridevorans]GBG06444.1 AraC family transcriptional regulator [Paenibacillus agaridevorans]